MAHDECPASPAEPPPPAYDDSTASPEPLLLKPCKIQSDGRIHLDLNSRTLQRLSFLSNVKPLETPDHGSVPSPVPETRSSDQYAIALNVAIQVVGSRGDVQPFVALGQELQRRGHRVRLATHDVFASFVRDAGLEFFPVGGDPSELMAYMVRNPGLLPSMASLRAGDVGRKQAMVAEMLRGFWRSCVDADPVSSQPFVADAIIANPPSFAHVHCAQALAIPVHLVFTMPWTTTSAFAHPLVSIDLAGARGSRTDMRTARCLSYAVVDFLTWQGLGDIINKWREEIDLEPISFSEGPRLLETLRVPFTYCWSPSLVPKPPDWGSNIDICGFFFRQPEPYNPPDALAAFLRDGPPPIYIGFGSIVVDDAASLSAMMLEAVAATGARALISRGWSKLDGPESSNVLFLDDCPHDWLFQHVQAVMHHGGAGTTACGLAHGRPTAIVPFFGDQPFWGRMVAAAGAGPEPVPYRSLTVERLVHMIQVLQSPGASEAAATMSATMRREDGVANAVSSFHAHLPLREDLECQLIRGQPASWLYRGKHATIRLSKPAAEILSNHLKIDPSRLKMLETRRTVIETRRWDPITGTVAAAWGVSTDLAKAAADTVTKPVRAYKRRGAGGQSGDETTVKVTRGAAQPHPTSARRPRDCSSTARALTAASADGMGQLAKRLSSGIVIIPFAFTEGFRSIPMLYGDEVRDYGHISDLKSGITVAAKAVVYGVYDGLTDMVILPYAGARTGGPVGAAKGTLKGVVSISSKLFTATVGLGAYPLQGIYKSVLHLVNSKTRRSVEQAKRAEGRYLAKSFRDKDVIEAFDCLQGGVIPR